MSNLNQILIKGRNEPDFNYQVRLRRDIKTLMLELIKKTEDEIPFYDEFNNDLIALNKLRKKVEEL